LHLIKSSWREMQSFRPISQKEASENPDEDAVIQPQLEHCKSTHHDVWLGKKRREGAKDVPLGHVYYAISKYLSRGLERHLALLDTIAPSAARDEFEGVLFLRIRRQVPRQALLRHLVDGGRQTNVGQSSSRGRLPKKGQEFTLICLLWLTAWTKVRDQSALSAGRSSKPAPSPASKASSRRPLARNQNPERLFCQYEAFNGCRRGHSLLLVEFLQ